jgi:hypothetical protein
MTPRTIVAILSPGVTAALVGLSAAAAAEEKPLTAEAKQ